MDDQERAMKDADPGKPGRQRFVLVNLVAATIVLVLVLMVTIRGGTAEGYIIGGLFAAGYVVAVLLFLKARRDRDI